MPLNVTRMYRLMLFSQHFLGKHAPRPFLAAHAAGMCLHARFRTPPLDPFLRLTYIDAQQASKLIIKVCGTIHRDDSSITSSCESLFAIKSWKSERMAGQTNGRQTDTVSGHKTISQAWWRPPPLANWKTEPACFAAQNTHTYHNW